jgi:hypothetical protein
MLKLTVAVLAVVLAGTASAGWRSLRVDGSSEAGFAESLAAFKEKLPRARAHVFGEALKDIWVQGTKDAEAEQREYTASDYYRQLDSLGYEQVVTFTDPTGDTARMRFKAAMQTVYARPYAPVSTARMTAAYALGSYSNTAERHYQTPQDEERQMCGQCR